MGTHLDLSTLDLVVVVVPVPVVVVVTVALVVAVMVVMIMVVVVTRLGGGCQYCRSQTNLGVLTSRSRLSW